MGVANKGGEGKVMSRWGGESDRWAEGVANKLQVGSGDKTAMQLAGETDGFLTLESQDVKGGWGWGGDTTKPIN